MDIEVLIKAAKLAGEEVMRIYDTDFSVEYKEDNSPLTKADLAANTLICDILDTKYPLIPRLSEESKNASYTDRKDWEKLFIIDPIDGTKEFVKKTGEFTINIAYVESGVPIMGVVYAPATKELYYSDGERSYLNNSVITCSDIGDTLRVVASKSHFNTTTKEYLDSIDKPYVTSQYGSSLKLCAVAAGKADMYPRAAPTMEWDTAAAHAVVLTAGGEVIDFNSKKELCYNKENLENPWFIVRKKA